MGHPPNHCAVVEDSLPGIQAAVAAGMQAFLFSPDGTTDFEHQPTAFKAMKELPSLLECS